MVSGRRRCGSCLRLAAQQSARMVFSGDTKQIQSVEAGDALRVLEHESRLKSVALTQVQRQKTADYRDAIQELRRNSRSWLRKAGSASGPCAKSLWVGSCRNCSESLRGVKSRDVTRGLRHP